MENPSSQLTTYHVLSAIALHSQCRVLLMDMPEIRILLFSLARYI